MKEIKVGINGLGRIGRAFLRMSLNFPEIKVVAVNDLSSLDNLAYLLKYDSAYGQLKASVEALDNKLIIDGQEIIFSQEKDPANLAWDKLGVDVVLEATGVFETFAKSQAHLKAGARRVVITAPVKDEPPAGVTGGTVLMGINEADLKSFEISSNASCTTNSASPLIKILADAIGVEKAILNTIHGYTATQKLVDVADSKDWRRGRAGAVNIIPSTTGAAIAVTKVITDLAGKFDGLAVRVPVLTGSLVDITFIAQKPTTKEEVNEILKQAATEDKWTNIFTVTEEPLVSSDIVGSPYASIADLSFTKVVDGNLVKVLAWYDNEMGYTRTLIDHVIKAADR